MIESPRWLATKGRFKECAAELQKIADINKKDVQVTEKLLKEMMPNQVVETVYGVASLFCHWRLAKNTLLLTVSWWTFLNEIKLNSVNFRICLSRIVEYLGYFIIGKFKFLNFLPI